MKALKLFFAIALLICLAPMPYGYYMLIRIVAAILFVIFASQYYEAKKEELESVMCHLANTIYTVSVLLSPFLLVIIS